MSETSPNTSDADADLRPNYDNQEKADELQSEFLEEEQEQREDLTKAEQTKRRLMEAKRSQTVSIPVEVGDVREDIEFRTLDGNAKDLIEEVGIQFGSVSEDEAVDAMKENGEEYLNKRDSLASMLAAHSVSDAYDESFFKTMFGGGERLSLIGDIAEAESSAGN